MTDADFSTCPFIKERLRFITYLDFCQNATIIKIYYNSLDNNAKIFYKWYIYSNIHTDEFHKNLIWEFLNSDELEAYSNLLSNIGTR